MASYPPAVQGTVQRQRNASLFLLAKSLLVGKMLGFVWQDGCSCDPFLLCGMYYGTLGGSPPFF